MRIDAKAVLFAPKENLFVRGEHLPSAGIRIVRKHLEPTRRNDLRIKHPERPGSTIPRVGKGLLALHLELIIDAFELRPRQVNLAAYLGVFGSIGLQTQRDRADRLYVLRNFVA